ncbi:flagellar biosynthetic protein FliO [Bartonella sp. B41]
MHDWLSNKIDTFPDDLAFNFILFIIVIAAITVIIMFLRHLNKERINKNKRKPLPRLTICDTIAIDRTHRLILIRCDNTEHLILIGGSTDIVIESNIIGTHITSQGAYKQKREKQPTTATSLPSDLTEKISFPVNETGRMQNSTSNLFMGHQNLEDSAITAEIEGRQEPSLFIPTQNK